MLNKVVRSVVTKEEIGATLSRGATDGVGAQRSSISSCPHLFGNSAFCNPRKLQLGWNVLWLWAWLCGFQVVEGATPGTLVGWGLNTQGQATAPANSKFLSMGVGDYHSLGILPAGNVIGWGDNSLGRLTIPSGLTPASAVAAGSFHSLGLSTNGKVFAWGDNSYGQSSVPSAALANVIAIAAGANHNVALLNSGRVVAWGDNSQSQASPPNLNGVTAIAAGQSHSMALVNGAIAVWGSNNSGQRNGPTGTGFISIAAGANHCLALRNDGRLFAWGDNSYGQTGMPALIPGAIKVIAGGNVSIILKSDRSILVYGEPTYGQDIPPTGLTNVVEVLAGTYHVLARTVEPPTITAQPDDANVLIGNSVTLSVVASGFTPFSYQWAFKGVDIVGATSSTYTISSVKTSDDGLYTVRISNESTSVTSRSAKLTVLNPPVIVTNPLSQDVGTGSRLTFTVIASGPNLSYRWRKNQSPIQGGVVQFLTLANVTPADAADYDVVVTNAFGSVTSTVARLRVFPTPAIVNHPSSVETYEGAVARFTSTGTNQTSIQWFHNGNPIAGATQPTLTFESVLAQNIGTYTVSYSNQYGAQVSTPVSLSLITTQSFSEVIGWGEAQAWNGSRFVRILPPPGLSQIASIASGPLHQVAVRSDGNVIGWGDDSHGEAFPVHSIRNALSLSAGDGFSVALLNDGTVTAWGRNDRGQISVPAGLNGVVRIVSGDGHTLALLANKTLVAWGNNTFGQGSVLPILGLVKTMAAGSDFNVILQEDGKLVAWGNNSALQARPPQNPGTVTALAAGRAHALALRSDGTIIGWGDNSAGQITIPALPMPATAIAAAGDHSLAVLMDGSVVAWGKNDAGQTDIPPEVQTATTLVAGGNHSAVIHQQTLELAPISFTADGKVQVRVGFKDGTLISADEASQIQLQTATTLTGTNADWSTWTGTVQLQDGILVGTGVRSSNQGYFRAWRQR